MSNFIARALVATTVLVSPAFAGGYVVPIIEPATPAIVYTAPQGFTWTGPYAGLYLGKSSFNLKAIDQIDHDALVIEHDAITEEVPAEVIEHPAVTEDRVVQVIEHPEVTETRVVGEREHPAVTETIPAEVREHPEVRDLVQIGTRDVETGTETVLLREDVYFDGNGDKQRDESHGTGWRHVPVYETRPVIETQPIFEDRVVQDAWVEVISPAREVVVSEAWTETVTETVVQREAWVEEIVETVVVEEARTETVRPAETVVVREAWTEVVRGAYSEQLTNDFSKSGNAYGIFAGYRHQWRNNLTAGVEAYYGKNEAHDFDVWGETASFGSDSYGVELQAGYAINRALPYLAVGYSNVLDNDALTLSLGLDYAINDRLIIGTKYSRHDLDTITEAGTNRRFEADGDIVSLRAAIRF